ncbi:hypothetical protein KHS38_21400 [Mucilaginibacter sp. Bleaf8]|uniref:hypothetical protein n=1 Tax=Mucilaginibacter sp. Bleaf8 TaxID=2834430 RepID=UPI001BCFF53C|nr:hypothetical protein [Mucilaginibacter sp. Bleaf8]MBS7566975.1 hypothetical protein [Mucilaginibacter sp. Bleaf8]
MEWVYLIFGVLFYNAMRIEHPLVVIYFLRLLIAAGATYFFLIKSKQKSSHLLYASLPHKAIALQRQAAPRLFSFYPWFRTQPLASAKAKGPCQPHKANMAARLSSEAGR